MKRFFGINWVQRQAHDHYVKQAKSMGYRSRAAFKLVEMNKRFNILKPGMRVIDLGAAPGGWSQVAAELVKSTPEKRIVFSVDLQHFDPIPGCYNMCLDMSNTSSLEELLKYMDGPVDLLLSDMSGNHSGDKDVDCNMMTGLNLDALYVAKHTLKKGGNVLMKMLYGPDEPEHFKVVKNHFTELIRVKPASSRSQSKELFYLGKGWTVKHTLFQTDNPKTAELTTAADKSNLYAEEIDNQSISINPTKPEIHFLSDDAHILEALTDKYIGKYSYKPKVPETKKDFYKQNIPLSDKPNNTVTLEDPQKDAESYQNNDNIQDEVFPDLPIKINSDKDYRNSEMDKLNQTVHKSKNSQTIINPKTQTAISTEPLFRSNPMPNKSPLHNKSKDRYPTQHKSKKVSNLWDKDA